MTNIVRNSLFHLARGFSVSRLCSGGPRCISTVHIIHKYEVLGSDNAGWPGLVGVANFTGRTTRQQPLLQLPECNTAISGQLCRYYRSGRVCRSISQNDDKPDSPRATPQLMDFPWVIWPSLWHTIRNWILSNLLIYRYLDQEFSLSTFKVGAIQALVHVSQELSTGNFAALDGLFTKPTLEEICGNFGRFNMKQRLDLAVVEDDIFLSFPYQIGIIFTNEGSKNERIFVEVTMCYHVFRDFQDFVKSKSEGTTAGGIKGVYENHDRISIANYRFIREFTRGVDDEWKITLANHFKPGEVVQER